MNIDNYTTEELQHKLTAIDDEIAKAAIEYVIYIRGIAENICHQMRFEPTWKRDLTKDK